MRERDTQRQRLRYRERERERGRDRVDRVGLREKTCGKEAETETEA